MALIAKLIGANEAIEKSRERLAQFQVTGNTEQKSSWARRPHEHQQCGGRLHGATAYTGGPRDSAAHMRATPEGHVREALPEGECQRSATAGFACWHMMRLHCEKVQQSQLYKTAFLTKQQLQEPLHVVNFVLGIVRLFLYQSEDF